MKHLVHFLLLFIAVLAGGSASSAYKALGEVPAAIKTAWRMQITCMGQLLPFIYELKTQPDRVKNMFISHIHIPILGGMSLSLSFLLWVMALDYTSVAHTSLIANSIPVVLVVGNLLLCKKVKATDILGVTLGVLGLFVISLNLKSDGSSFKGDLIAEISVLFSAAYWLIGNEGLKNRNLPLWSYMITLNVVTCFMSFMYSVFLYDYYDFVGWVSSEKLPFALILGLGPGIFGHMSYNYLLKYLGPLIVTSFLNLSPLATIIIAWICGYQQAPKLLLWLGGFIILAGNIIITVYKSNKKPKEMVESVIQEFIDGSTINKVYINTDKKEVLSQPLFKETEGEGNVEEVELNV
jgi:drug/metabolite transporter (DMT)-like permease